MKRRPDKNMSLPSDSHTAALLRAAARPAEAALVDAMRLVSWPFSASLRLLAPVRGRLPWIILSVSNLPPRVKPVPFLPFSVTLRQVSEDAAVARWQTDRRADLGLPSPILAPVPSLILRLVLRFRAEATISGRVAGKVSLLRDAVLLQLAGKGDFLDAL